MKNSGSSPAAIVDYWIGPDNANPAEFRARQKLWYTSSKKTDAFIAANFGETLQAAESGQLTSWAETNQGSLGLVILFDQFSRNLNRGTPDAYKNDNAAVEITAALVGSGNHTSLNIPSRVLLYHPMHHAENINKQDECVRLFEALLEHASPEWHQQIVTNLRSVKSHRDLIQRFNRFPHRNRILNRKSTAEELEYLEKDARKYGQ